MKSFKTFITEVRVGYDEGIPKFKAQSNDDISKNHKILHSGNLESGHQVTVARHNETGQKHVFVHDNKGKHVGTIEAHHTGEVGRTGAAPDSDKKHVIHVSKAAVHKSHQGQGLMTNVYKHLIHHGHTLRSDGRLTGSAHKMWSKLANDKKIKFGRVKHWTKPSDKIKKHNVSDDTTWDKADHDEWSHYVATKK